MLSHALHASFAASADQRMSDRRVLRLDARVATPIGEGGLLVKNLSRSGLLLEGFARIKTGCEIEIELPGGAHHPARVMWADETLFGCRFAKPLTQGELSAAVLRAAPPAPATMPDRLVQGQALARLRERWVDDTQAAVAPTHGDELPFGTRLWIIGGLGLAGWTVPAAAAWLFC